MRCRLSLLTLGVALVATTSVAAAAEPAVEASVHEDEDRADRWGFEEMRYFFGFFYQDGKGRQSQAGPVDGKGSERTVILEPMASFRFRTNRELKHEVLFPVDVISAASPDALDVVSGASAVSQAFWLDVSSTYRPNENFELGFRWGPHFEETLRSFFAGPSFTLHLAEENTVVSLSGYIVADAFDPIRPNGEDAGQDTRTSLNGNLSLTQVLSPTTLFDCSVGLTTQSGVLQTSWNSVMTKSNPADGGPAIYREAEVFPENRFRSAFVFRLSQHIPASHTTVKAMYRFYADENHVFANSGEVQLFQYFSPWLYARAHGRLHVQPAIDFWVPFLDAPPGANDPRTSDSDLEAFVAREAGLRLVLLRDRAPLAIRANDSFNVEYVRYQRTNGLHVDFGSLGYTKSF